MKRRTRVLAGLCWSVLAGCGGAAPDKGEHRSNAPSAPRGIVLVTVDGWWDPATKTESIRSDFAANLVRLTNTMTPCPQVRPAVCSMLTGRSPIETGVRDDVATTLPATIPLVSQSLTEKGWRTAAFIADPRVGHGSGLERGFELFDPPKETLFGSFRRLPKVRSPIEVVADFSTWIPSIPSDASFFAWIHLTRPMIDPPAEGSAEDVQAALERLKEIVAGSARLESASLMVLGTAGQIDLEDGANSGYFLTPSVLRIPVLVRSGTSGGAPVDPQSSFSLIDVAGWISREAGIEAAPFSAANDDAPRVAWTWRGHKEFGWPAEVAARQGSAFCARDIPGSGDLCVPWDAERPIEDSDRRACAATMDRQAKLGAASRPIPALAAELTEKLKTLGLRAPSASAQTGPPVAREIRERVVPSITRARRLADHRKAVDADASYQQALVIDPTNFGALIEAGEALALDGQPKLAGARLEPALRSAPWNPEAWHWTGHVSYLEKQIDRAEAQWLVSDTLEPGNGDVLYDLACARSIAGDSAGSLAYLRRAWTSGFRDVNTIQVDADLRNLRADPAYVRFMREVVH
jgi:Flp pilus assembly protein TadD